MATNLSPENEQYIQNAIAAGLYHDRGEILDRAVELLKKREQLIRDVNLGIEQLERGEGKIWDMEEINAKIQARLETT
jgi:Arc/MetJ-type ribon-helix-helix transcriptional regulator